MGRPAPMPDNFEALSRCWDNPHEFAQERAKYYAQVARDRMAGTPAHWTEADRDQD